eukprot:gb/GECH01011050.1/.p1 GENE.gb/GECH01011050.1/~~gb/GECH01011050.1/.p1  ORF type:complete len:325 (+),score=96.25 gb/GECH01011050.1/:1-975(+)
MKLSKLLIIGLLFISMFMLTHYRVHAQDDSNSNNNSNERVESSETENDDDNQDDVNIGEIDVGALMNETSNNNDVDGDIVSASAGGNGYKRHYSDRCGKDIHFYKHPLPWNKYKKTGFYFHAYKDMELTFVDLGCPCEQYEIIVDGISKGFTSYPDSYKHCYHKLYYPLAAYNNFDYSARQITVGKGYHTVKIRVKKACSLRGKLAVGFSYDDGKCCRGEDFRVIRYEVPGVKAQHTCDYYGLDLADLTKYNNEEASITAFTCLGHHSSSWVNSWNHNPYYGTCVALNPGYYGHKGSVHVPYHSCYASLPSLCQVRPKKPKYYW